ncbi:MAG: helix-turn-helix domain-containing protein [Solobacterium sp.]|nr:helix-turn-helix domain-containing protein [Solobacterium sp.]
MKMKLSENIRAFRKQRRLTQEQLAEVLNVTTGAVYKWESGMSVPELNLIIEMADFFDTSVDALLGYRMKDNRLQATVERLQEFMRNGDPEAMNEAEKALKKYPNSFKVVYACASVYLVFGSQTRSRPQLLRSIELMEHALKLIAQNTDPQISAHTLSGFMGAACVAMGEYEKGLDILKKNNAGGMFSDSIGSAQAIYLHRWEEAEKYLADALMQGAGHLVNTVIGFAFVYDAKGEYKLLKEITEWGLAVCRVLKTGDTVSFADKVHAILLVLLAHAQIMTADKGEARISLREAAEHVTRFDRMPDFSMNAIRFAVLPERYSMYDGFGLTAGESVENLIGLLKDPDLREMWKEEYNV